MVLQCRNNKKTAYNSKLNELITTTTWLTTVTSVAIPEPIRNRLKYIGDHAEKDNSKDTIECNVIVHNEMNFK